MKLLEQRIKQLNDKMNHVEQVNKAIDQAIEKFNSMSLEVKREGDTLTVRDEYVVVFDIVDISMNVHDESQVEHYILDLIEETLFGKQSNWGTD